jgi:hypothetical protein
MATHNSTHVSDALLAELQAKAAVEGKIVDELAEVILRKGLEDQAWQDLLEYGRKNGAASGYAEDDVHNLIKEWRREQSRR